MKLFNKQAIALLVCVITINILCVTSVSYGYFTANINGSGEEMLIKAGSMEITYTDSNVFALTNFLPGDSATKQFKVHNDGTLNTIYNIKLNITNNTFDDKENLLVTLQKKGDSGFTDVFKDIPIPTANGEHYIYINKNIVYQDTDTYQLIIKYQNVPNVNQQTAENATLDLKVEVDANQKPSSDKLASGYVDASPKE